MTTSAPSLRIGVLGAGTLGSIFAHRLLDAGADVSVHDADPSRVAPLAVRGAHTAEAIAALASGADAIVVSLPDPEATSAAVLSSDGLVRHCRPGTLVIDTSTVDPDTARDVSRACAAQRLDYVEAPLSGGDEEGSGVDAARTGATTFICGGEAPAIDRARPVLQLLGRHVLHVGPAGHGATAKLVSNHMAGLHNLVAAEALAAGRAAGLSLQTMLDVLQHTDGKSYWLTHYLAPRLQRADFEHGFAIDLQHKDHRLFGELARRHGAAAPLNELALALYQSMRVGGLGRKDLTEAANVACTQAGLARYDQ